MLLLLRPGVGRRRAGSSLASTTPSSALCGPPSGIRLRPGVGRRRAGSSLASTTPSSALCGPPSGIRLRPGVGRRRVESSPASTTPFAALVRPHGPAGATNVRADSRGCCCYTRLPDFCCHDHPPPPLTHHSKKSHSHPTPPHSSSSWDGRSMRLLSNRQDNGWTSRPLATGWDLATWPLPGAPALLPTRPYHWPTTTFIPPAPLWETHPQDPSPVGPLLSLLRP